MWVFSFSFRGHGKWACARPVQHRAERWAGISCQFTLWLRGAFRGKGRKERWWLLGQLMWGLPRLMGESYSHVKPNPSFPQHTYGLSSPLFFPLKLPSGFQASTAAPYMKGTHSPRTVIFWQQRAISGHEYLYVWITEQRCHTVCGCGQVHSQDHPPPKHSAQAQWPIQWPNHALS